MLQLVLFNFHDVILFITVFQCLFFSCLIFYTSSDSQFSNLLLAGLLLCTAAIPVDTLINYGAGMREWMVMHHPNWFYVFEFGYWLQGPLLLWFVRSVVYRNFKLGLWDTLYVAPCVLYFAHQLGNYHMLSDDLKAHIQQNYDLLSSEVAIFYLTLVREFLRVFFGYKAVMELRNYQTKLGHRSIQLQGHAVKGMNILAYGFLSVWVIAFLMSALILLSVEGIMAVSVGWLGLSSNYVMCALVSISMALLLDYSKQLSENEQINPQPVKSVNQVDPRHVKALESLMATEKPYLESNLTLESLAQLIRISPRNLSSIINRHYGCNFFEFVNKYRIEAAKAMLIGNDSCRDTVLDIMYNSGFKSKATFNNFFKKSEGVTPREYRKRHAQLEHEEAL